MPKKQRVRGCFQCSERRIDCDLAQPQCAKCVRKGIECSGLARIRFAPGLASRGRLKYASVPLPAPPPAKGKPEQQQQQQQQQRQDGHDNNSSNTPGVPQPDNRIAVLRRATSPPQPWLPPIPHQARGLYSYFSRVVAPAMVVIDSGTNGYRNIILSMACNDELLGRAIGVVAAQHVGLKQPGACEAARRGRSAVIDKLRKDALVAANSPQLVFTTSTWATLLILLVGETVTGGSEFGQLFRMLVAAAQNCDLHDVPSVLRDFLLKQTHMFEIISRPQLSTDEGVDIISQSLETHLDWVYCDDHDDNSPHALALNVTEHAFREASKLYLSRASSSSSNDSSNDKPPERYESVAWLRQLVTSLDPSAEGAHALVWPCFVAAAESTNPEDRQFFAQRLDLIHKTTKFDNVRKAAKSLPVLWAMQDSATGEEVVNWTSLLGKLSGTLII